ncbi:6256_t:CDS:1 [Ambispora leptoticha]|uniref:6256_t:CDS:1 n=1 Tax=Ambispora leptoticha TaxID=144679 RepID=A0A9N9AFZ1_9GLOM|nr:6256_t:CDS:1 [Ambispora leptoticha]
MQRSSRLIHSSICSKYLFRQFSISTTNVELICNYKNSYNKTIPYFGYQLEKGNTFSSLFRINNNSQRRSLLTLQIASNVDNVKLQKFVSLPRKSNIYYNNKRQFQSTPITLIPILPTILFAIPLCIPYFLLIRLAATRIFPPSTRTKITKVLVSFLLAIPTIYFLTSETAPNTYRRRHMLLWPWERKKLEETSKNCVQQVKDSSNSVSIYDPRSQLVNHVCKRLWQNGVLEQDREFHSIEPKIYLIDDDDFLDGVAYPSSDITLTTGWLRIIDYDESLLAAVIAHELAHIMQDHAAEFYGMSYLMKVLAHLGEITNSLIPNVLKKLFGYNNNTGEWRRPLLFLQYHSQTLEREADIIGQEIMARAGYDPAGALELWQLMVNLEKLSNSSSSNIEEQPLPSYCKNQNDGHGVRHDGEATLAMHPSRRQRVKYLTENLLKVQKVYENTITQASYKNKSFIMDLKLRKLETTVWAIFGNNAIDEKNEKDLITLII